MTTPPRQLLEPNQAFALLRGNGQPWLFVKLAIQIAASADMLRDIIRWTAYGDTPPSQLPPRPPMREWIAMYRKHRTLQNGVAAGMGLPAELATSGILDELRAVPHMSRDEIASEIAELSPDVLREMLRPFIGVPFPPDDATLRAMLNELDAGAQSGTPEEESLFDALLASPAGQYFLRVWWPCWVLYREYPPRLLRAARLGDLDALDRLLRLDKFVVHDPGVARLIGNVMSGGSANARKQVLNAIDGRPKVKLTDSGLRAGLAGLISQFAFLFYSKVTAPEIQALFDAIERVRTGGPADTKISAAGEAWSKAVQRARTWPGFPTHPPGQ